MRKNFIVPLAVCVIALFLLSGCSKTNSAGTTTSITSSPPQPSAQAEPEQTFPPGVPVLMYHSLSQEKNNDAVISPERFAEQMEFLFKNGYKPISMDELYDYISGVKGLPAKPVVLTFDDGYRDNLEIALPILKQYGFKSTIFTLTAEGEMRLTWSELNHMKTAGMEVVSHSYTHRELGGLDISVQAEEIKHSKQILDRNLRQETRYFAYPNSSYSKQTIQILKDHGIRMAFTTEPGWVKRGDNPFNLKRVWIGNSVDISHFEERLTKENYSIL